MVLENIPLGKKENCQVRSVHDGFTGEGSSQFDLSFEYKIELELASADNIDIFKSSNGSVQWEYRAVEMAVTGVSDGILNIPTEEEIDLGPDDEELDPSVMEDLDMFIK